MKQFQLGNCCDILLIQLINTIIPPAGDSSCLTYKWTDEARELVETKIPQVIL